LLSVCVSPLIFVRRFVRSPCCVYDPPPQCFRFLCGPCRRQLVLPETCFLSCGVGGGELGLIGRPLLPSMGLNHNAPVRFMTALPEKTHGIITLLQAESCNTTHSSLAATISDTSENAIVRCDKGIAVYPLRASVSPGLI
jgi:hypothetical protein